MVKLTKKEIIDLKIWHNEKTKYGRNAMKCFKCYKCKKIVWKSTMFKPYYGLFKNKWICADCYYWLMDIERNGGQESFDF